MPTSWERSIEASMRYIHDNLYLYLSSNEFESDWNTWNFIRSDVKWLLLCGSFTYSTRHTKVISEVMYNALLSHLVLLRHLHVNRLPREFVIYGVLDSIHGTMYDDLVTEYKKLWHHAEYIQIRWRRCITDPYYILCRNRLINEFETHLGSV